MKNITIVCLMVPYASYGMLAIRLGRALRDHGVGVRLKPAMFDEKFTAVPEDIKELLVFQQQRERWEFVMAPPTYRDNTEYTKKQKRRVLYTLWETDQLTQDNVFNLNCCEAVITSSEWNKVCFKRSGVKVPIYVVPLGHDPKVMRPDFQKFPENGKFVFGTAVRTAHGGVRKGAHVVTWAFLKAFDGVASGVELWIKGFPDCKLPTISDPRVKFVREYLTDEKLCEWYQGLNCFVSGSTSEGWGLHQHEAMACAKPVMSVDYGGVQMFFKPECGYVIDHQVVSAATETYLGVGGWAAPKEFSIVQQMQFAKANPVDAFVRGLRAYDAVKELTWAESGAAFIDTLKRIGII